MGSEPPHGRRPGRAQRVPVDVLRERRGRVPHLSGDVVDVLALVGEQAHVANAAGRGGRSSGAGGRRVRGAGPGAACASCRRRAGRPRPSGRCSPRRSGDASPGRPPARRGAVAARPRPGRTPGSSDRPRPPGRSGAAHGDSRRPGRPRPRRPATGAEDLAPPQSREHDHGEDRVVRRLSGIPIDPVFAITKDARAMRRKHGLAPERTTILVSAGGFGVGPVEALIHALLELQHPAQVVVICGRSEELKRRLDELATARPSAPHPRASRGGLHDGDGRVHRRPPISSSGSRAVSQAPKRSRAASPS